MKKDRRKEANAPSGCRRRRLLPGMRAQLVTPLSQIEPCSNKTAPPPQNETAGGGRAAESARGADRVFSQGTTLLSMLADGVRYLMPRDAFPANARDPPQPGVNLLLGVVPPYG